MFVLAIKAGAIEFLTKSFRDQALLDAIHRRIQLDFASGKLQARDPRTRVPYDLLTQGEREVLALVVGGLFQKANCR